VTSRSRLVYMSLEHRVTRQGTALIFFCW